MLALLATVITTVTATNPQLSLQAVAEPDVVSANSTVTIITVGAAALKGKATLTLSGTLEYQACDDRVCFKPGTIPLAFELQVKK